MNAKCADKYKMAPPSIINYNWNFWTKIYHTVHSGDGVFPSLITIPSSLSQ